MIMQMLNMECRIRNEMRYGACAALASIMLSQFAFAQPQQQPPAATNAPRLVREANELLLGDKPAEALRTYEQAQSLKPDAREIAFDQALAHYRLGEYDKAREAFTRAAGGAADALADDALYGLGTCDHAEALTAKEPKDAVSKIENAMRNYQSVLGNQREHTTARDANLKAASYWRQLKQQLQQQQQQQNQDNQNKDQNDEQKQDQQQQQQDQQQQSEKNQQDREQQQQQAKQDQQKQQEKQEQEQKEQQASAQKEDRQEQKQAEEQKEEASRDQAERKLREMMQAMRDRKKHRREETKTPTYRPTEKDW